MSSVTQAYGANAAFIEELYERYRANPESVSVSWQEFFHDYEPRFAEEFEEEAQQQQAVAAGGAAAPAPQPVQPAPAPQPVAPPAAPTRPTVVPSPAGNAVPLRGAASKIVANM